MGTIIAGLISAVTFIFLFLKMDIRKVLAFDLWVDLGVTILLGVLFFGTFAGMVAAAVGGAFFSVMMYVIKLVTGYKKLTRKGWQQVPPKLAL